MALGEDDPAVLQHRARWLMKKVRATWLPLRRQNLEARQDILIQRFEYGVQRELKREESLST